MYDGCRDNGVSLRTPFEENSIDNQPQMRYDGTRLGGSSFLRLPLDDSLDIPVVEPEMIYDGKRLDGSSFLTPTIKEPNPVNDVSGSYMKKTKKKEKKKPAPKKAPKQNNGFKDHTRKLERLCQ